MKEEMVNSCGIAGDKTTADRRNSVLNRHARNGVCVSDQQGLAGLSE